jgi:hypothetical protein
MKKQLTLNDISTMDLINFTSQLEMANTSKNWTESGKIKTENQIWDCLFSQVFGFDWNESELYNLIRYEYIPKVMIIVSHFTKGYVTCTDR